eukprot:GHVU01003760.1.p1 GENE.GHVU01003760.1~~GHVU01003760.1.p1  ORF type:complete len:191 (-),score=13.28 GHVU01003760.1:142-714(-)
MRNTGVRHGRRSAPTTVGWLDALERVATCRERFVAVWARLSFRSLEPLRRPQVEESGEDVRRRPDRHRNDLGIHEVAPATRVDEVGPVLHSRHNLDDGFIHHYVVLMMTMIMTQQKEAVARVTTTTASADNIKIPVCGSEAARHLHTSRPVRGRRHVYLRAQARTHMYIYTCGYTLQIRVKVPGEYEIDL